MNERRGVAVRAKNGDASDAPPVVTLRADDGATAEVHHHGAHVTSWRPAPDGDERLYLSGASEYGAGKAIRGGIPVIFPQFATEGPLPRHGFARTTDWAIGGVGRSSNGMAEADLVLRDSEETRAIWNAEFSAVVSVRVVGARLAVTLAVENVGDTPFAFTAALHTYLRVSDVRNVRIVGLEGTRYRVPGSRALIRDESESVVVGETLERVYASAPPRIELHDGSRTLSIISEGFPDAVLWNPGREAAASVRDIEPGGEQRFVCIEAAAAQSQIELLPRRRWSGTQTLVAH
ncbi:MAG TPA: D-hexose-6-phosphate mutarotase [Gemmatimonadaceae bacterium]|jgi:glucose-6-phosphate 1-epimerase|nr:D-hexose-6-phosphate mutarotase [Gemmatimonadaceae bacterium]